MSIFKPDVPNNYWGHQYARTGDGYAGIGSQYHGFNNREYIEVRLTDSMDKDKTYYVEFYISLADSVTAVVDDIGVYLSKDSIYGTGLALLPYAAQIANPQGNILADSVNWTRISGYYIAGGGEKFLTIGGFLPDTAATIDTLINNGSLLAYYYIDDVSVVDSGYAATGQTEDPFFVNIYPNPASGEVAFSFSEAPLEIFITDVFGRRIKSIEATERNADISFFPSGMYFLNIKTENGRIVRKIIRE